MPGGKTAPSDGEAELTTLSTDADGTAAAFFIQPGNGKGKAYGLQKKALEQAQVTETTRYLYDGLGLNVLKEYTGKGAPRAAYYYANGQVLARKMYGLKGSRLPDRDLGLARSRCVSAMGAMLE